ncbi:MAG TPA: PAS domain S-box protein [Chryseosolibacter sp.]
MLLTHAAVFALLIFLNFLGRDLLARVLLAWAPAVVVVASLVFPENMYTGVQPLTVVFVAKLITISACCIPLLVLNPSDWTKILAAGSVPLIAFFSIDKLVINSTGTDATVVTLVLTMVFGLIAWTLIHFRRIAEAQEQMALNSSSSLSRNYQAVFEQASDAIMITDLSGKFVDINPGFSKMLGYTKEEIINYRISDIIDPDQLRAHPIRFKDLEAGERIVNERTMIHKDGSRVDVEADVKKFDDKHFMAISRDIRERKNTANKLLRYINEQKATNHSLNERIKELTTLYKISELLGSVEKTEEQVFAEIPKILPPGWQYPEICAARLIIFNKEYASTNFAESRYKQKVVFEVDRSEASIEIVYLEERPDEFEGPFFKEERNLLNVVGEMLRIYVITRLEQRELNKTQANLSATINNTDVMIWSVDSDFNLLFYNESFRKFNRKYLNIEVHQGINLRGRVDDKIAAKWEERYQRVLKGEQIIFEESVGQFDFRYSLSPIIEPDGITGVSVFGDDVTERNIQTRNLTEANRKINDLKLMALRSVMNPHFIFNVLSSIQFFITRNDRLNAINYLTSFSKLMRKVLTRSVADAVSLKEELDLLQDYVKLEKLRFEEKFDFFFEYDENLNLESIRIPTLLVQPYVENAILHGLYNKEGHGNLFIRIKVAEEYVIFEVEDDGVGREAASKLQGLTKHGKTSMGTKITEDRLRLINADSEMAVTYTDLGTNGTGAGTLVRIRIRPFSDVVN